jgi:hypothetical protein
MFEKKLVAVLPVTRTVSSGPGALGVGAPLAVGTAKTRIRLSAESASANRLVEGGPNMGKRPGFLAGSMSEARPSARPKRRRDWKPYHSVERVTGDGTYSFATATPSGNSVI